MPRKKRERIEKHKQSLGDVLEDPETYGVRVSSYNVVSNAAETFFLFAIYIPCA